MADIMQPVEFLAYEEGQVVELARLAYVAAHEYGATNWALDLMAGGNNKTNIHLMADCWRSFSFEPPEFADQVMRLANANLPGEED